MLGLEHDVLTLSLISIIGFILSLVPSAVHSPDAAGPRGSQEARGPRSGTPRPLPGWGISGGGEGPPGPP